MTAPRDGSPSRLGSTAVAPFVLLAVVLLVAACGEGPRARPSRSPGKPLVGTPGVHPVSSEALAGHPTAAPSRPTGCPRRPREHKITRRRWLSGFEVTEYFPTPERWFSGRRVKAPGLRSAHRVDWLYSASGLAMEGSGVGLDGRYYAIADTGRGRWVNAAGHPTVPGACASHWSAGEPAWLAGGWRNARGEVTFPLEHGGWSNGPSVRAVSYRGVTFEERPRPSMRPYRTVAVDPNLIPLGSRVFIPAYRPINGGWFVAGDTGGAIIGRHLDVYRPPTGSINDGGRYQSDQRVYVVPPR